MKRQMLSVLVLCFLGSNGAFGGVGISITPNSWNVGTGGAGEWTSSDFTATNIGDSSAKLNIRGTDTQNWALAAVPGLNQFALSFSNNGTTWTPINPGNTTLIPSLSGSASQTFKLKYQSPTNISDRAMTTTQVSSVTLSVISATLQRPSTTYTLTNTWMSGGSAITIDSQGNVLIGDSQRRISKYSQTGELISSFGQEGTGDGSFQSIDVIATDNQGYIYVIDCSLCRIQIFNSEGQFVLKWGEQGAGGDPELFRQAYGMAVDNERNIYITEDNYLYVYKFTYAGGFISKFGGEGTADNQFSSLDDIKMGSNDHLYILDSDAGYIKEFDLNGNFINKMGSKGALDGMFELPTSITVHPSGCLYVNDTQKHSIQMFNASDGSYLAEWNNDFIDINGNYNPAERIVVGPDGTVYATSLGVGSGFVLVCTPGN